MRAALKTFAEEFERVLVESDTSVRRLARLSGVSRRTLENWLYRHTARPRYVDPILKVARALQLPAVDADRLLLSAGYPTLNRLRQNKQLQPNALLEWQLPPDVQLGQKRSALQHAQMLLEQMPWNEEAHREVMELLALNGRRSEALKQFELCRQALHDELGVEPSAETLALYERIRRTVHFSRDNIPAIVTPLFGREEELEALAGLLADPNVRLVTIAGLGGIGKTRLALDTAWQHTAGQFKDGVTFVPLAALETVDLLVLAIAQALHLPAQAADEQVARQELLDYLRPKQLLLVLDNCEHLLDGMNLVADLLEAAPRVQILATSREPLRLRGEHVVALHGLPYIEDESDHAAAQLFASAARRVVPDFEIDGDAATKVNRLCRLVEGIPLALELAATWLDTMSLTAVIIETEANLYFLAADLRNLPPRHRSLRAVLDSTWSHLRPDTRQVFAALAVFRGSFSRDAAQDVAGARSSLLQQLVNHSLLQYDRETDRYQLHEMLRQFAAEKLTADLEWEQAVTQRHFAHYNDLAQRGGAAMRGGDQVHWMARLELEESNIRQAVMWAAGKDVESAARLVVSLHNHWYVTGRFQEAAQHYERILPHQDHLSSRIHPWLIASYAQMVLILGNTEKAVALLTQALPLFLEQGDEEGAAFIYFLWADAAQLIGRDLNVPSRLAETGLQHALTPVTDSYYASLLLEILSDSLTRTGRFQESQERIQQGYQLCQQRDDKITATSFLKKKVMLAHALDRPVEAGRFAEEHLQAARHLGLLINELLALDSLRILAFMADNLDQAEDYGAVSIELARDAYHQHFLSHFVLSMGDILMAKGASQEALPFFKEALFLSQKMGSLVITAACAESLAHWIWRNNKKDLMPIRWIACAAHRLDNRGEIVWRDDIYRRAIVRTELEMHLGQEELDRTWAEGEKMSFEEVIEKILDALPE